MKKKIISKERGQTSRGNINIPTRLVPRETSILCRQALKILLKKGEKVIYGIENKVSIKENHLK